MLFTSPEFILLLVATMALYYAPGAERWQVPVLILASAVLCFRQQLFLLPLLLLSVAINLITVRALDTAALDRRRLVVAAGVSAQLALLGFFKYSPLFASTFLDANSPASAFLLTISLPVGISFFTFHGISLLVDTFREGDIPGNVSERKPRLAQTGLTILHYIAFVPQLVAGPIVKARDFLPQIAVKRWRDIEWERCFKCLVQGYFFKMVIADNMAQQTIWISYPYFLERSTVDLVVMLFAFSVQIFADFHGYTLIALGIAGLFGYRLPDNFNYPYLASSFADFWRRWHISLSSFLKDYLYVPLGGSRRSEARTYLNLLVVMLLGGLWHGAAWSYMVWGGFHGALLALERFFATRLPRGEALLPRALRIAIVFCCVTLGWLLFKLPDFGHVIAYLQALATNARVASLADSNWYMIMYCVPVAAYHLWHTLPSDGAWRAAARGGRAQLAYGFMLFLIVSNHGPAEPFIYFQF